jgi:hypothetical protein
MAYKKKKYVPYTPKLLYTQLPQEAITWSDTTDTRQRIIELFKQDKTYAEISDLTRCRLAKVRAVVKRYLHPEEFESPPETSKIVEVPKVPKLPKRITIDCKQCGKRFEVYRSAIVKGKKYCSNNCYNKAGRAGRIPA